MMKNNYLNENYEKLNLDYLGFVNGFNKEQILEWYGIANGDYLSLMKESQPIREDFIRISSIICPEDYIFNFKFQTKTQCGYIHICAALGSTDDLWKFLEDLCQGKDIVLFISELEGPNQLLFAQKVDDENVRLTLISDRWFEHKWNVTRQTIQMDEQRFEDNGSHINFDVIINRKHFIYTFYHNLAEQFYGLEFEAYIGSANKGQTDSDIIKQYLGYLKPTDKDLELGKLLENGAEIEAIEQCLKEGANPNAIVEVDCDGCKVTILNDFIGDCSYTMPSSCNKKEFQNHILQITKLLYEYGAMPPSVLFDAIYCLDDDMALLKFMLNKGTRIGDELIGCVATDADNYASDEELKQYYAKVENLYDELLFEISRYYKSENEMIINYIPWE